MTDQVFQTVGPDQAAFFIDRFTYEGLLVFQETARSGRPELALIAAQDALAAPPQLFPAEEA